MTSILLSLGSFRRNACQKIFPHLSNFSLSLPTPWRIMRAVCTKYVLKFIIFRQLHQDCIVVFQTLILAWNYLIIICHITHRISSIHWLKTLVAETSIYLYLKNPKKFQIPSIYLYSIGYPPYERPLT